MVFACYLIDCDFLFDHCYKDYRSNPICRNSAIRKDNFRVLYSGVRDVARRGEARRGFQYPRCLCCARVLLTHGMRRMKCEVSNEGPAHTTLEEFENVFLLLFFNVFRPHCAGDF